MSDEKNLRLNQISDKGELGKAGPNIKHESGTLAFSNAADNAYAIARGDAPVGDNDAITKAWVSDNLGLSKIPLAVIVESTTGTHTYNLPSAAANNFVEVSRQTPQQVSNYVRIAPASGDKISVYGKVIEYPGYLEIKSSNFAALLIAMDATHWALVSDFRLANLRSLVSHNDYAIFGRDAWVAKTSITTHASDAANFSLNGYLYFSCGRDAATNPTGATFQYNDTTNAWAGRTVNPTPRNELAGFLLNGFGYTSGGFTTVLVGTHTQFNDSANTWTAKTANGTPRRELGGASLNGFGYQIGGFTTGVVGTTDYYNDNLNSWVSRAALNTSRREIKCSDLNGYIYAAGGGTTAVSAVHEEYNDSANAWLTRASLITATFEHDGFTLNGLFYNAGGSFGAGVNGGETFAYNDALNSWVTKTGTQTTPRYGAASGATLNGYGYSTAGIPAAGTSTVHEQYN